LALKWPNDVLLGGGKVAGILLEGLPGGALAIGIGINLIAAPGRDAVEEGAVAPVCLLEETGVRVTPEAMLDALAVAFAEWETRLVTYGFDGLREAWLSRAARLGDVITARTAKETLTGTFETVDATGQLVLNTSQGRISIAAADVFF
jgi:BirA family biotin operon repressor/biotin-[acetyl-CoA-carboxylase] ligase